MVQRVYLAYPRSTPGTPTATAYLQLIDALISAACYRIVNEQGVQRWYIDLSSALLMTERVATPTERGRLRLASFRSL